MIRSKLYKVSTLYPALVGARENHTMKRLKGKVAIVTASTEGIRFKNCSAKYSLRCGKYIDVRNLQKRTCFRQSHSHIIRLVIGTHKSIGYAIAKRLGAEGASIIVSSRKEANVQKAVSSLQDLGITVEGVVCHVGNKDQRKLLLDTAVSKFGGLDILVSNAAVNPAVAPILETAEEAWDKIFDINVKCAWLLAKEVYPKLLKRGGGNIVFVSSIAAYQPMAPLGAYSVSKTTLLGLTKSIASEVVHENIRVNCVAPGIVQTKFAAAITSSEESLSMIPMGRFGKAEEIAGAVAFMVSDDASFMTGETIVVAGGTQAHL